MKQGRPTGMRRVAGKQLQLTLLKNTYEQIKAIARNECSPVREIIMRLLRLGIFVCKHTRKGNQFFIRRDGAPEKELVFLD